MTTLIFIFPGEVQGHHYGDNVPRIGEAVQFVAREGYADMAGVYVVENVTHEYKLGEPSRAYISLRMLASATPMTSQFDQRDDPQSTSPDEGS